MCLSAGVKRQKTDDNDDSDNWDDDEEREDSFTSNLLGLGKHYGFVIFECKPTDL